MNSIAVVILNYNGIELLRKFLPTVIHNSAGANVIVADNCSTDGSQNLLQTEFPQVQLISIPSNLGFCGGYNYALSRVEAKYFVLLNSDVEVTEGWLAPMFELFESDSDIAAVQPKILSYREKQKFEYAGAAGGFIDKYGYPFCRGRLFETIENDVQQFNDTVQIFWATGACMMVRADMYRELHGLDESFFAHMEEIDLCWKLNRLGKKIMYTGKSSVYHVGGATLAAGNPRKTYYNFRNGLMLLIKNYSPKSLWLHLPPRIFLDWIACIKFLLSGNVSESWSVLNAHLYIILHIREIGSKRKLTQDYTNSYSVSRIYQRSIVVDYFLKGKKFFSDLNF